MRSLNGWQRIGVVLSASWFLLVTATFGAICGKSLAETDFSALWGVEAATARATPSSPPASGESFKGMFDDVPITKPPQDAPRRADRYAGSFEGVPDSAKRESSSRPNKSKGMFDDLIPPENRARPAAPVMFDDLIEQYAPQAAKREAAPQGEGMFDDLPDLPTGSTPSTAGGHDDLIRKGLSLKDLQAIALFYSVVTAIPIALLWALGYTIAWIVAGFRMDRREALASPRGRIEPELSARADESPAQGLD